MIRLPVLILFTLLLSGCSSPKAEPAFSSLTDEFVFTTLSFSPVTATSQGYHKNNGVDLDTLLDDFSPQQIDRERSFYTEFNSRLKSLDTGRLTAEDRADLDILQNQIALALFDLDIAQTWVHNPTLYVETIGNGIFSPYVLAYAPFPDRMRAIIARLDHVSSFLSLAKRFLRSSPIVWTRVAREENQGNIDLIDKTIRANVPGDMKAEYDIAARSALSALHAFDEFLGEDLPRTRGDQSNPDWRLGADSYKIKFRLALETDRTPDQVLENAESDLKRVRAHMLEVAAPLHTQWFAAHKDHTELKGVERENRIISEVLARISDRRSTPVSYLDDARADLAEARNFVQQKDLLTLPGGSNLQVIETPEFVRGIYGVGGFDGAPVLEPQLGAFYWVTPIASDWPPARVESKLREYNFWKLKLLTIHEAMPGHYVQAEVANSLQPKSRRVLRALYGNTPYVEGWAQYSEQMLLDNGFPNHAPEMQLTFLKEELRVLANAILDIRLQTGRMTDQQALEFMQNDTFQEREEAVAKLQRAQLSSAQLPSYFVGWRDWIRVRDAYKDQKGGSFNLKEFNDRALHEGAVPLPVLAKLLTGKELSAR